MNPRFGGDFFYPRYSISLNLKLTHTPGNVHSPGHICANILPTVQAYSLQKNVVIALFAIGLKKIPQENSG